MAKISYFLPFDLASLKYENFRYTNYSIIFRNLSPSYYSALSNRKEHQEYEFSLLFEPSLNYTNVNDGLGFIGASNDTTIVVTLDWLELVYLIKKPVSHLFVNLKIL